MYTFPTLIPVYNGRRGVSSQLRLRSPGKHEQEHGFVPVNPLQ
jgi:hypothetical protein